MEKILKFLTGNKIISISTGIILLIAGTLSRIQFIDENKVMGFIIPLLFVSLSFGIIFSTFFKGERRSVKGLFVKSVLAPWAIVMAIVLFNNFGVESPMIRAGSLFFINILFFNKEIHGAFNQ